MEKTEIFNKSQLKTKIPLIKPGDIVKVYQKIKEKDGKTRIQVFEGQVLAKKHGNGLSSTITVRKVIKDIGAERIFPIHSPLIDKIEVVKRHKTRRAKLYFLRDAKGKRARLKRIEIREKDIVLKEEKPAEEVKEEKPAEAIEENAEKAQN